MPDADLVCTRRSLHAVAELVLAGPQHRATGDIRLRVSPGGFRTVSAPDLRVEGDHLVSVELRVAIDGGTARSLAAAVGHTAGEPAGVYGEGSGCGIDDELHLDRTAAGRIVAAYALGDEALRMIAPDQDPVLWPEHFDVGIRVGDANYGVSPGDGFLAEPYAYVGVDPVPDDPYWNAPFGRAQSMTDFTTAEQLATFFRDGTARFEAAARRIGL
ncbi:MAG: hypothetical protein ABR571_05670 [Jatrophihabitans sp.]|uniref:hypothetical protein n=1 Tax=Jatrophihabitans sp. TaxID=1932789 RepID=UPI00390D74DE